MGSNVEGLEKRRMTVSSKIQQRMEAKLLLCEKWKWKSQVIDSGLDWRRCGGEKSGVEGGEGGRLSTELGALGRLGRQAGTKITRYLWRAPCT